MSWTFEGMELRLGDAAGAVEARLARWQEEDFGPRLWRGDPTLWSAEPLPELADRLGWLRLPEAMAAELPELERLGAELAAEGARDLVVLGMGGSSLAPEVFQRTLGNRPDHPRLAVLDSTHPDAVQALAARLDLARTLFLVSSKSGTTTETLAFFRAFWDLARRKLETPGERFVAITDPGTLLAELARERGFRRTFDAPPDVGGRYSALSVFGLVPAAGIGADVAALLASARRLAAACGPEAPARANPALVLGVALGELAGAGRDKLTFVAAPELESFPDWIEQLVAESTGKDGKGIVPVVGEPPGSPAAYGADRVFVALAGAGGDDFARQHVTRLAEAGHPAVLFRIGEGTELGGEMLRWEIAVAAAGAVLGIHPFDQPDVQLAKELARAALGGEAARAPAGERGRDGCGEASVAQPGLAQALGEWLAGARPGGYLGLHAYLAPAAATTAVLRRLQGALRDATGLAATVGYGPRFLHSTGQLHKGGPAGGLFLQLVDRPRSELAVPEAGYGFGELLAAQAEGDRGALLQRGRSVLRVDLGGDPLAGLEAVERAVAERALRASEAPAAEGRR